MNKNQGTKEKACVFFASDYHFEMISLPYINEKIQEKEEVIILTENNLENTINILLSKMNLTEEKKKKISSIDWTNNDLNKFKRIRECIEKQKNVVIFIKGKENYIKNINKNIKSWTENEKKLEIIDCYDVEEIGENLHVIMDEYEKVLNTSGIKEINKI